MKNGSWPAIVTIYAFGVAGAAATSKIIPLKDLFHQVQGGEGLFTLMLALVGLPAAILAVASGVYSDRYGPRLCLLVSAMAGLVGNVICAVAGTAAPLIAGRLIEGLALIGIFTSAPSLLMSTTEGPRRTLAMTLWSTYSPVGVSLGFAMGAISAARGSLHLAFALQAAAFLLIGLVGLALREAPRMAVQAPVTVAGQLRALAQAYRQPRVVQLAIGFFLLISMAFGVSVILPGYFIRVHQMTPAGAAGLIGGTNLTMIAGSFATGLLLNRGIAARQLFAAYGALAILMAVTIFLPSTPAMMLWPALCAWAFAFGGSLAALLATLPLVADPSQRAAAGLFSQGSAIATLVNPPLWLGLAALLLWYPLVVAVAIGWLCALLLVRRATRPMEAVSGARPPATAMPPVH
ncbi:MAG: MFS transporter [Sphingobium sp.]